MSIKRFLTVTVLSLSLAAPVLAGPWEDGLTAYDSKDYATAVRLWLPLAEQSSFAALRLPNWAKNTNHHSAKH